MDRYINDAERAGIVQQLDELDKFSALLRAQVTGGNSSSSSALLEALKIGHVAIALSIVVAAAVATREGA